MFRSEWERTKTTWKDKARIKKVKIFFIVIILSFIASIVWYPLGIPMRCQIHYLPLSDADCSYIQTGPGIMPTDCNPMPKESRECFSLFHNEYWQHPEWELWVISIHDYFESYNPPDPNIMRMYLSYAADFSDNTILMGAAHEVVIGKVLAQVSANDFVGNPATQYSVEIIKTIKGDEKKGTIIVNQEGGYKDNTLYLMEDSIGLLQPGSTYLLATRYDPELDFYTLNPHPNASKLLTSDMTASIGALKKLADIDPKTKELELAYPNEHLIDADVAHGNTRNAFRDLPDEAKAAAQSRADEAKASLESQKGQ